MRIRIVKCQNGSSYNRMDLGEDVWAALALAHLTAAGHSVDVEDHGFFYIDSHAELHELAASLVREAPDLVLFALRQNTSNPFFSLRYAALLKARGFHGLIASWGDTGADIDHFLTHGFDFVVTGEEPSLMAAIQSVASGGLGQLTTVSGVATIHDGHRFHTPATEVARVDEAPDLPRYGNRLVSGHRRSFYKLNMLASRGCYARCTFCHETARAAVEPLYTYRAQSPARMVDELERAVRATGVRDVFYQDSNFFGPGDAGQQRIQQFARLVVARGLDVRFIINTRANDVDEDTFGLLKAAGLRGVFLGVETFVERRLKRYRKGTAPDRAWSALGTLNRLGMQTRLGVILFDPDSTPSEVLQDLEALRLVGESLPNLRPNPNFLLNILAPKGGTPIAEELKAETGGPTTVRYAHPEHLRVMQMRFAPQICAIRDPRVSATAEALRLLGYELMLHWTERQEEIAVAASGVKTIGGADAAVVAQQNYAWTEGVYGFSAKLACLLARQAHVADAATFNGERFIASAYDLIYRNILAFNAKHLGDRGLYLYTPTTDCTPKFLPSWLSKLSKEPWRGWRGGIGAVAPQTRLAVAEFA